ncbi:pyocin knob domain-containing protein [Exiguobacterium sp. R-39]|uniref:pyocin knob domain-containing protein n=1 Tax=Exiguobacterium sp. R-39 TaxID=3416708 RepID=UPI003CF12F2F
MPYSKPLPEWKNAGTKPPQSKIDAGWAIGEKPPAAWWNWHMYNTYYALQELQLSSVHSEKLGAASGVATLGADSKLTASQLPAIGSAQITDNSITNTDLATDVKVGSLATLTTMAKGSVTAAINETKTAADAKIPLTQRAAANGVATLDVTTKIPIVQIPLIPTANLTDGSITDTKLAADIKVGSLATLATTAKGSVVLAINEVETDYTNHNNDSIRHTNATERAKWDAAQLKKLTESNGYSISSTNADMNNLKDTGFYYGSGMTNGPANFTTGWSLIHAVSANYLVQEFVANSTPAVNNRKFWRVYYNGVWNDWLEVETTAGAQAKVNAHAADAVKHIEAAERTAWNAKAEKTAVTTTANGLMIAADKAKLDGVSPGANKTLNSATNGQITIDGTPQVVYAHPTTHSATMITEDATHRFTTDDEKASYAAKETPTGAQTKANTAETNAKNASVPRNDTRVNNADLNTYTTTQVTAIGSPVTNGPAGFAYGSILVAASAVDRITQLVFDSGNKKLWTRYGVGSPLVWSTWIELATSAVATASVAGLMSAADFSKLTGIAANANNYSHPTGDGNLHVPATGTTNLNKVLKAGSMPASPVWGNVAYSELTGVPSTFAPSAHGHAIGDVTGLQTALDGKSATTHTHTDATTSASGFQSAADKTKLNSISTGANKTTNSATNGNIAIDGTQVAVYAHPTGDGNSHIPATGTTNSGKVLKAGATANSVAWGNVAWGEITGKPNVEIADRITGETNANYLDIEGRYYIPKFGLNVPDDVFGWFIDVKVSGQMIVQVSYSDNMEMLSYYRRSLNGGVSWGNWGVNIAEDSMHRFTNDTEKAKWNNSQLYPLTQANGSGLASITDFNQATGPGYFYAVTGQANAPLPDQGWFLHVMKHPTDGVTLMQVAHSNTVIVLTYIRRRLSTGVWGTWTPMYGQQNIQTGSLSITPSAANVPTGVNITFPTPFKKMPTVIVSANTTVPGSSVTGVAAFSASTTGCTIYVTRTNTSSTGVNWVAIDIE